MEWLKVSHHVWMLISVGRVWWRREWRSRSNRRWGQTAVLSQMASVVPGGHCTLRLCFYSIFSENELHCAFLLGTRDWVCVRSKGRRDAVWTQTHTDTWTSAAPGEWTLKHVTVISTILTNIRGSLWGNHECKGNQVKSNWRKEWKKREKRRHFVKGEIGKRKNVCFLIRYIW